MQRKLPNFLVYSEALYLVWSMWFSWHCQFFTCSQVRIYGSESEWDVVFGKQSPATIACS